MDNPNLTWRDIAAKAGSGELRYTMTNPASPNSGFTALVGVSAALSAGGDASQPETLDQTALKNFFKGQMLTAGSSGWLAERYIAESDHLDGMINYESVLMELNRDGKLPEKLYLIYPKEGIITADYPLMLINADKREAGSVLDVDIVTYNLLIINCLMRSVSTSEALSAGAARPCLYVTH